jgi:hypothetical protein
LAWQVRYGSGAPELRYPRNVRFTRHCSKWRFGPISKKSNAGYSIASSVIAIGSGDPESPSISVTLRRLPGLRRRSVLLSIHLNLQGT